MMTNKKNRRSKALSVPEILTILYFLLWRHWAQKANFIISILWQLDVQPHIFQIKSPIYFRLSQITRHPYYFSQKWKKNSNLQILMLLWRHDDSRCQFEKKCFRGVILALRIIQTIQKLPHRRIRIWAARSWKDFFNWRLIN